MYFMKLVKLGILYKIFLILEDILLIELICYEKNKIFCVNLVYDIVNDDLI